ncbi:MAG TPA: DUF4411 family protein [Acidimicrobiales bacterium]|nr:DUF4411 family protein [Acidimicrobiales bacterium]
MRLLDANVFIEAKNRYYGFDLVPAFWTWLEDQAESGEIASTEMIYDELKDGGDDLAAWVKDRREVIFYVPSSSQAVANAVGRLGTSGSNPRTTSRTSSPTSWTAPTLSS